jgi:GTP cyclohydrolase II
VSIPITDTSRHFGTDTGWASPIEPITLDSRPGGPGPAAFVAPVLEVSTAIDRVRRGEPVLIDCDPVGVLCLPAAVMDEVAAVTLAAHGRPAIVVPTSIAMRFGLEPGAGVGVGHVALAGGGGDRDLVAVARALVSPRARASWFCSLSSGPVLWIVDDAGIVRSEEPAVMASELSSMAGFGRVTVAVTVDRQRAAPVLPAGAVIRRALRELGPMPVSGPAHLPLAAGPFLGYVARGWDGVEHLIVTSPHGPGDGPVRVVRSCVVGQTFRTSDCACRDGLEQALAEVAHVGRGALVCLQPGPDASFASCTVAMAGNAARDEVFAELALAAVRRLGDKSVPTGA